MQEIIKRRLTSNPRPTNFEYISKSIKICYLFKKIHFTHFQQYDENQCVYLARKGHHSQKIRQKHDHACSAQNYLDHINFTQVASCQRKAQWHLRKANLDSSVERTACERVVVLWVNDNLHDVVCVSLKHLCTDPFLLPVPQLDQHVV